MRRQFQSNTIIIKVATHVGLHGLNEPLAFQLLVPHFYTKITILAALPFLDMHVYCIESMLSNS